MLLLLSVLLVAAFCMVDQRIDGIYKIPDGKDLGIDMNAVLESAITVYFRKQANSS